MTSPQEGTATILEQLTAAGVIRKHGLMWVDEERHGVHVQQHRWGADPWQTATSRQYSGMQYNWVQRYAVVIALPPNKLLAFYSSVEAFNRKEAPTKVLEL